MFSFDKVVNRFNTESIKYDRIIAQGKDKEMIPMWIADMDFEAPTEVQEALREAVDHGVYGYHYLSEAYFASVQNWFSNRFNFTIKPGWISTTPGVVTAICIAIQAFTEVGDAILIQQPVYNPFQNSITNNNRKVVNSPLILTNNRYEIDFIDFEQKIIDEKVKMFILCSPHNPVGRVWTEGEIKQMGDICVKHQVLVVSDEIHCDFVDPDLGRPHIVYGSLDEAYLNHSIICTAPSKTFNMAGLQVSNVIIANETLRKKFDEVKSKIGIGSINSFGKTACRACYEHGGLWADELNKYIASNKALVKKYLAATLPKLQMIDSDGTFLIWLDFSALQMEQEALMAFLEAEANLWLHSGTVFGEEGRGFVRMNIGCRQEVLQEALDRLAKAIVTTKQGGK